jgi:hypothetical protein
MASFLSRLFGAGQPSLQLRGIPVEVDNSRPDIRTDDVLARLDESLALIEQYAPIRFRHLQRDIRAIRVERYPCRGAFMPVDRTVMTELTFLNRRDITAAPVASSILHEGVHARVHAFRVNVVSETGNYDFSVRARLRAGCSMRLVPPELGAPVIERAMESLALDDESVAPVVDWNVAMERTRQVDRGE